MALQLGFDGTVRLADRRKESLQAAIDATLPKYQDFTAAIEPGDSDREVFWRLAFAILSVHSPIGATFQAYKVLRAWRAINGHFPAQWRLAQMIGRAAAYDGVVQYAPTKARYLLALEQQWRRDRASLLRGNDSDHEWRLRLARNVKGLGIAKASFAVALCCPTTSDVCCIDSHMYQLFTGKTPKSSIPKGQYLDIEATIRRLARRCKVSTFTIQWLLWDAKRGIQEPHSVLSR
jgi:thermostable 8-oxoguanine DNA glycosylase